jgi:phage baseplate assembly protein gpV
MSKSFALVVVLLTAACSRPAEKPAAPPKPVVQTSAPASIIVLTTPAGERVIEVAPQGNDLTITYAGGVLHGRFKGEKRKYEELEVKFGDEGGFKVRTLAGKLLWKVKVTPEKIKVSDNEENKNPYELKIKDAKVKVYAPGDRLLGEVRARGDHVDVGGKFRAAGTSADAFYGVELLDGIPPRERAVIFAELAMKR